MQKVTKTISDYLFATIGLITLAYGVAITVSTPWGVSAWDVFHLGVTQHTPLTLGQAAQLTGMVVIGIAWFVRRQYVTVLSILNAVLVGWFVDLFLKFELVPFIEGLAGLFYLELGVVIFAAGMALYLAPGRGAGPRDALMMSLSDAYGFKIGPVRMILDLIAVGLGALLGGPVGIGTIIAAVTLGPWVQVLFRPALWLHRQSLGLTEHLLDRFIKEKSVPRPSDPAVQGIHGNNSPPPSHKPHPK